VTLIAQGSPAECAPPPPGVTAACSGGTYFIQACDTVQWTFGDGATQTLTGTDRVTHTYAHIGVYNVAVHISNARGSVDMTGGIFVTSNPPASIDAPDWTEVSEAAGSVTLHVTRSGNLSRTNAVAWRLTADPNVMSSAQGSFSFAPGETDHTLTFPIARDYRFGFGYSASLALDLSPDGAVFSRTSSLHLVSPIWVQDAEPLATAAIDDIPVRKGATVAHVPLDLSVPLAFPCCRVSYVWRTVDGTARSGVDFAPHDGQAMPIQPNTTRTFIEIPLLQNDRPGTRSFDIDVYTTPIQINRHRITVTIVDDGIRISPAIAEIRVGTPAPFVVSVAQPFAAGDAITLTSSDPAVMDVPSSVAAIARSTSVKFNALALAAGTVTITAIDPRSNLKAETVVSAIAPISVAANPAVVRVAAGADAALSLTTPRNAPVTVALSSSDPSVATVDAHATLPATLLVHGIKPGRATIAITSSDGDVTTIDVEVTAGRRRSAR